MKSPLAGYRRVEYRDNDGTLYGAGYAPSGNPDDWDTTLLGPEDNLQQVWLRALTLLLAGVSVLFFLL